MAGRFRSITSPDAGQGREMARRTAVLAPPSCPRRREQTAVRAGLLAFGSSDRPRLLRELRLMTAHANGVVATDRPRLQRRDRDGFAPSSL